MRTKDKEKLRLWQERLSRNESAYEAEKALMDGREALYRGDRRITPMVKGERTNETPHVRNLCAELVEAQVSSSIPQPKVTARRAQDEGKAKLIEDMLRNELDRLPFEQLNDMMERTVPIQGGGAFLVEWDNTKRSHASVGELVVSLLHPKQIVPQDGVFSGVEDMDYIIIKLPQTKGFIRRRYGVDVEDEGEREPEVKGSDSQAAQDMVTQYTAYYRNDKGGIGLFSWVNDTQLEDLEDYQARRLDGIEEGFEELPVPVLRSDGSAVGGMRRVERYEGAPARAQRSGSRGESRSGGMSELWPEGQSEGYEAHDGVLEPERIPFYKPDIYPVLLQKNVSVFGRFLGDSDVDKIADQQNTTNRIEAKIIDKLVKSGSYMSLPDDASIKADAEDMKIIRPGNPAAAQLINVYDMEGRVQQDMAYLEQVYQEARQVIGITDSFQGRHDATATSGKAKEFAAAQSAGRLESKRVMKDAAYAALFEAMFKFKLAYADEPRPVVSHDGRGSVRYQSFNRYDFLERDEAGEWWWNDQFLFSCDTSAPLASNREAMWQETRMNLQTGAFGNPSQLQTLILFWTKMELLHYPGAGETRSYLEEELKRQQAAAQMQQTAQMPAAGNAASVASDGGPHPSLGGTTPAADARGGRAPSLETAVVQQARADAARDMGAP